MHTASIGVFDSGVGGTSIWREITNRLPAENTIYLADSKHAPYGEKSKQDIIDISIENTEFLIAKGVKLIVVACNTATTNAISILREKFDIPFVGIEPAIKPAALATQTNSIGILATQGTLSSRLFHETCKKFTADINVIEQEGTGLVPLIEKGKINSTETKNLLKQYLQPMIHQNIDHLVLGCSHYPYLIPVIKSIIGNEVKIIDSGYAVAKQTESLLRHNKLLNQSLTLGKHLLLSNLESKVLTDLTIDVENVKVEIL